MDKRTEGTEAGKHPDMGIKTVGGQDNSGHLRGSNQRSFDEQSAQQKQKRENENELNQTDERNTVQGTENV